MSIRGDIRPSLCWLLYSLHTLLISPFHLIIFTAMLSYSLQALVSLSLFTLAVTNPVARRDTSPNTLDRRQVDNSSTPIVSTTDTNSYSPIPVDLNVPEGYNMGMATVSIFTPYHSPRLPIANRLLTQLCSKMWSRSASKASAIPTASSPTPSPPPPVRPHYHQASSLQPLVLHWERLQMIVHHVAHVIASCIPVRLTAKAIRTTLLAAPLVDRMCRVDLSRSRFSLQTIALIATT